MHHTVTYSGERGKGFLSPPPPPSNFFIFSSRPSLISGFALYVVVVYHEIIVSSGPIAGNRLRFTQCREFCLKLCRPAYFYFAYCLPFTQKISLQPIPEISWLFRTFGCGYPYEIFFLEKVCLHPVTALLRHKITKLFLWFFALIKFLFLKNLVEIIFR